MMKLGTIATAHQIRSWAVTIPEVDMVPEARKTVRMDRLMLSS